LFIQPSYQTCGRSCVGTCLDHSHHAEEGQGRAENSQNIRQVIFNPKYNDYIFNSYTVGRISAQRAITCQMMYKY